MADAVMNREFLDALHLGNRRLQAKVDSLNAIVLNLNEKLNICIEKYGADCFIRRRKPIDWRRMLRDSGYTRDPKALKNIYRAACKQFNMSSVYQNHGLYYVSPNNEELGWELAVADPTAGFQLGKYFNFSALLRDHPAIIFKIAVYTMVKDTAISVVARFDVHDVYPPIQGGLDRKTGLSYRFHWGSKACSINSSPLPAHVLAPIFVSRDWHEMFASAFYYMNSFSFESLGEYGIFCKKTTRARWQRVSDIEITWIGSIMETSNPKKSGPRWDRSRWGMHVLGQFLNLRNLTISLDETSNGRIRRKDEPENMKKPLERSTRDYHNYRMTRDLRKLRGIDNVYQLRGIEHIEVYDNFQFSPKTPVRDQTFVRDLRRQVCSPKSKEDEAKAKTKNLKPLLRRNRGTPKYRPSRQVKQVLKLIFNSQRRYVHPGAPQGLAGDDSDSDADDNNEDEDEDVDDDHNPDDFSDSEDDDVDYDQLDNDHQNPHDDTDSDEDGDDAPDQGVNALRVSAAASGARNFANDGGKDEDMEMDGLLGNVVKLEENSDDGFEFISASPSPIKVEDDDDVTFIRFVQRPPQAIDLSQMPDMEDPDTAFPSIEEGGFKEEVKSEERTVVDNGMESIPVFEGQAGPQRDIRSPFGHFSPRRGQTEQSSLFVRQSPSSRRSFSSRVFGYLGRSSTDRKRSIEDDNEDEDQDIVAHPSLRRRLSYMVVDNDEEMEN